MRHRVPALAFFAFLAALLGACGGGGGGGSGGFSYDGKTGEALVTNANAREFADTAFEGTSSGDAVTLSAGASARTASSTEPSLLRAERALHAAMHHIVAASGFDMAVTAAIVQESDSISGDCGGRFEYNISANDQTGVFSGSATFRNYRNCDGSVVNGTTGFSGVINLATLELEEFTFTIGVLSVSGPGFSVDLTGTLAIEVLSSTSTTILFNVDFRTDGRIFRFADFAVTIDESVVPAEFNYSGRVYHPDHGFVTVSTVATVKQYQAAEHPHEGQVLFTGRPGTAGGDTTALVTFTSVDTFIVEVDNDGDDVVDTTFDCVRSADDCTVT